MQHALKSFTLGALGLLMAGSVWGQKCTVDISPEFKTNGDKYLWNHLYSDATGHYVLFVEENQGFFLYKKFTPTLQKFDRAFNLSLDKEIPVEGSDIRFDNMLYARQKFVLCTRRDDKKAKKVTLTATTVGLDGATQLSKQVASIPYDNNDNLVDLVRWKTSPDTSSLVLAAWADNGDKKLPIKLMVSVQDNKLANLWNQFFTLPYTQDLVEIEDVVVSNTGQVLVSAKVYADKKDKKAAREKGAPAPPDHKMVVFALDGSSDKVREINPEVPGKFVMDLSISVNRQEEFYYGGIYTNDGEGVIQGVFCASLNAQTGDSKLLVNRELSDAEIKSFSSDKDKSGNEGLDPNFEMKNLLIQETGGLVLIAEETFKTYESYSSGGTLKTVTNYNTNDLLVVSISPEGSVNWVKMVPKSQAFGETEKYSSYAYLTSGADLCFVYNDDKDNISQSTSIKAKPISSFRDAVAGIFVINGDGKMERQKVFSIKKDTGLLLVPERSKQISANELFFVTTGVFKLTGKNMYHVGVIRVN